MSPRGVESCGRRPAARPWRRRAAPRAVLGALLAFAALALGAEPAVVVGDFSSGSLEGWQAEHFRGATRYALVEEDGRYVLRAESRAAASGLYKRVRVDLARTPVLHWSWKIARALDGPDETTKAGDDYAARVYVVFSGGLFFWRTHAIDYVWAAHRPAGSVWPNAYTANARMIALRAGASEAGRWVHERRDVRADYRRLFGRDVRYVDAVAVMTDTDDTGQQAVAWYGDIYFAAE